MVGAQLANGANIKVDGCGIDWRGGREGCQREEWTGCRKEDASQLEIGRDGRNSSDGRVGGAASVVPQPDIL
jgi:hypothetical protein